MRVVTLTNIWMEFRQDFRESWTPFYFAHPNEVRSVVFARMGWSIVLFYLHPEWSASKESCHLLTQVTQWIYADTHPFTAKMSLDTVFVDPITKRVMFLSSLHRSIWHGIMYALWGLCARLWGVLLMSKMSRHRNH